jgi:FtsX-like permease family
MENLIQDLRLVLRVMRRRKGFAAATLLTLALGIGANTAVFSVVYGVLLRPLPYPEADRLVRLSEVHPGATAMLGGARMSNLTFHAWSESARTIDSMAAYSSRRYTIIGFDEPLRVDGAAVSPDLFSLLRARPAGNPLGLAPLVHGFVREVDRNAAIDRMTPLARSVAASVSQPRFVVAVLATFAALALALAAVGLYGVLSYSVSQRRRELGVRAALGATRCDLLRLVVGQGLALVGAGMVLGLAGAAALARLMANVLFGVTPHDAMVFATAPLLLLVIAFAACLLPGRRAASADPAEALRCE